MWLSISPVSHSSFWKPCLYGFGFSYENMFLVFSPDFLFIEPDNFPGYSDFYFHFPNVMRRDFCEIRF